MDYELKEILCLISKEVSQTRDKALAKLDTQREIEMQKAESAYDGASRALELVDKLMKSKNAEIAALKQEFQHLRARLENQNE